MPDKAGVLKIHLPIQRDSTKTLRGDCVSTVTKVSIGLAAREIPAFLLTDHNTHGPAPFPGFKPLFQKGFDYIGFNPVAGGAKVEVLQTKIVNLTIDKHECIGVRVRITWPSGRKSRIWFVQTNLGRGVGPAEFLENARRVKAAFKGHCVWGFDEIDEADRPEEHELLAEVWDPKKYQFCGWGTYSPVIVTPRIRVLRTRIIKACDGMKLVTPHRDLVEVIIAPRKRLRDRLKKN